VKLAAAEAEIAGLKALLAEVRARGDRLDQPLRAALLYLGRVGDRAHPDIEHHRRVNLGNTWAICPISHICGIGENLPASSLAPE